MTTEEGVVHLQPRSGGGLAGRGGETSLPGGRAGDQAKAIVPRRGGRPGSERLCPGPRRFGTRSVRVTEQLHGVRPLERVIDGVLQRELRILNRRSSERGRVVGPPSLERFPGSIRRTGERFRLLGEPARTCSSDWESSGVKPGSAAGGTFRGSDIGEFGPAPGKPESPTSAGGAWNSASSFAARLGLVGVLFAKRDRFLGEVAAMSSIWARTVIGSAVPASQVSATDQAQPVDRHLAPLVRAPSI